MKFGIKRIAAYLICLLFLLIVLASSSIPVFAAEWETYYSMDFEKKINSKLRFKLNKELRFSQGEQFFQQTDIFFSNSINKRWEWGGGYKQGFVTHRKTDKRIDSPYLYGTYKWDAGDFKPSVRLMYEQRYFSTGAQHGRARFKAMVSYPVRHSGFTPYISDECYLQLGGDSGSHLNANTFSLGFRQKIFKWAEADFSYKIIDRDNRTKYGEFKTEYDALSLKFRFEL